MMKRLILAAMLPWLCLAFLQAQQTLPKKLQHFYAPLDKSQVPTGFLYDLSWSFASPSDYRGVLTDSNFVSPDVFGMLFGAMRGSMVDSVGLPSPGVFLSRTKHPFSADTVPIAVLALSFDRIRPDAVDGNLLFLDNGQLFDVPGRSQSPYFQDTVFAATVLRAEINTRAVVFQLPSELLFGNLGESPSISIDPGDGNGWRSLPLGQALAVQYDSDGAKEVVLRLDYPGFTRYSHSRLNILPSEAGERDGGMIWPQDLYESLHVTASESYLGATGGATLHIFYNTRNCNSVKRMIRPLIVVEGYEDGAVSNTFERMFDLF